MLFSIIIPVYNVEKYLNECIQSVISQVDTIENDCEILLIDDGSTDSSGKICDIYKERYPNIVKTFHNTNQGLLLTRRFGYQNSHGEYMINCDSDDKLEQDMLEVLENAIIKYNSPDIIFFNYNCYTDVEGKQIAYNNIFSEKDDCMVEREEVLLKFLKGYSVVSLCSKICNRRCVDLERNYEMFSKVGNGEDTLQTIEFFNKAQTYVYINKPLYDYRMGSGMTRRFDSNYFWGFKKVLEEIWIQKNTWNFADFDRLFSVKVLQTVGRAITQSRYNNWDTINGQIEYLLGIRNDPMVNDSINYIYINRNNLQKSHFVFLMLFKYRFYRIICAILNVKNRMG